MTSEQKQQVAPPVDRALWPGLLLLLLLLPLPFLRVSPGIPHTAGPLSQGVYVWQRNWTPSVEAGFVKAAGRFTMRVVLSAEIHWTPGGMTVTRVQFPPGTLATASDPVILAVRIHAPPSPLRPDSPASEPLLRALHDIWESCSEAWGLQIDFDCPESGLEGYAAWLERARTGLPGVPLTITTLPSWLDRRPFGQLARAADGIVLQVHSLPRRRDAQDRVVLCDTDQARRDVDRAARHGRPFWVALPTYAWELAYDEAGRCLGADAEGVPRVWPGECQRRVVAADPESLAYLISGWMEARPALLRGVIWYRLPVDGDRLNWRWPTLAAVMSGRVPRASLAAATREVSPGLTEIVMVNDGEADWTGGLELEASWPSARYLAAEGLAGIERTITDQGRVVWRCPQSFRLRCGDETTIGWVRLSLSVPVKVLWEPLLPGATEGR